MATDPSGPTRTGVVTAVADGSATVDIGASGVGIPGIPYIGARPRVDDVVLLIVNDVSYAILGTVGGTPAMPCGSIVAYPAATPPDGWLLANGAAIPAEHTELIALVGANTPDLRGRFLVGADANHALGATGGSRFLPQHAHPVGSHTHTVSTANFFVGAQIGSENVAVDNHSHTVSGGTGNTSNNTANSVNSEPPWRGITYIIKH